MVFEQVEVGGDRNFGYLIGDEGTREGAVVDASYMPERMLQEAARYGLTIRYIICTHSHQDHVAGNELVAERTSAPVVMHESTSHACQLRVKDNQKLPLGGLHLRFLHTPGHIPDHLCVLAEDRLITGDLLFVGKIGGTGAHFPGSNPRQQWQSLQRLIELDHTIEVWPGHDYGVRPSSTIGNEIATNPFLLTKTYEDFLYLKDHWAEYKKAHNIR
jgi:hydroxyacylglutathione hydrolase